MRGLALWRFRALTLLGVTAGIIGGIPLLLYGDAYQPNQVIVRFAPSVVTAPSGQTGGNVEDFSYANSGIQLLLSDMGVTTMNRVVPEFDHSSIHTVSIEGDSITLPFDLTDTYVLQLADTTVSSTVGALSNDSVNVLAAQPNWLSRWSTIPTDSLFGFEWGLKNTGQYGGTPGEDIGAERAWDIWTGEGAEVPVAIIDTGIDPFLYEDLRVYFEPGFVGGVSTSSFDYSGHGTSVGGLVGAIGNNRVGVTGVNWDVKLHAIKVFDPVTDLAADSDIGRGIHWAQLNGIPVMNLSLGGPKPGDATATACKNAHAAGSVIVAAMGNDRNGIREYPAAYSQSVVAVGAMTKDGIVWDDFQLGCQLSSGKGSNYGTWIDLLAPGGRQVMTTRLVADGSYYSPGITTCGGFGGTSAATPIVAGVASLLKSYSPQLTNEDIEQVMNRTARDKIVYGDGFDIQSGWGLVNAEGALKYVGGGKAIERMTLTGLTQTGVTGLVEKNIFDEPCRSTNGKFWVKRHTLSGHVSFATHFIEVPDVWVRGNSTVGWNDDNPHSGTAEPVGWAQIVPGSITSTGFDVYTYVYEVFSYLSPGTPLGWCPSDQSGARVAYTAIGRARQDVDLSQSFFVPQICSTTSPTEGGQAISKFATCPNNDVGQMISLNARIKVVVRDSNGSSIAGIPASDIYIRLNGGTPQLAPAGQMYRGPGADSVIANRQYNPLAQCPDLRLIPADAPTDANGTTYITFVGCSGVPGVAQRDATRKWGHYDSELPVYVYWNKLQGRLTSASPNGSYVLQIKNADLVNGLTSLPNQGEVVNSMDYNGVASHASNNEPDSADPNNWWRDFDSNGLVSVIDKNFVSAHANHKCDFPNNP